LKESQAVELVSKWRRQFFVMIPKKVDSTQFYLSFLKYYGLNINNMTRRQFEARFAAGTYFQNGVATLQNRQESVKLLSEGPEVFTPQEIVASNYERFVAQEGPEEKHFVCLSKITDHF
jgi:hypothetical protein